MLLIEILFPEICNLYGDLGNIRYIKGSIENTIIKETHINERPYFADNDVDLIYMGSMTEDAQLMVINELSAYKDRISELIERDTHFLITGNALEIFGRGIIDIDGTYTKGLHIFPITTRRDMMNRYNSLYLGKFNNTEIVGYKSQFTYSYYSDDNISPLFITEKGVGFNKNTKKEGLRKNNFHATYVIGPLLILNPYFTIELLYELGVKNPKLIFENESMDAYKERISEYKNSHTGFFY